MTLKQYIDYALAEKQIEYHSYNPNAKFQCVDSANDYITKVWGLKAIIGTDAKDFPTRLTEGMEFVTNTKEYLPEPGEIAVWSGKVGGGAGHIAVVTEKGKQTVFKSLDQNWSKPLFITLESHKYTNVIGFIRKKGSMAGSKELEACMADRKKFWEERDQALSDIEELEKLVVTKENQITGYKGEVTKKETKIAELQAQLEECKAAKPTTLERFTSRKFILALLALIVPIANQQLGWELSPAEILAMLTPLLAFMGVEGFTDHQVRMEATKSSEQV